MRIAFVSPYDWCVPGGVNSHIEQLAARFRDWGHQVAVFAPSSDPDLEAEGFTAMGRPRSFPANGSQVRITLDWMSPEVKAVMAVREFDIVHLHEPLMPLLPYHFLRYSKAVNVGTFHASREGGSRVYQHTRILTRPWFRKLDGKIAVSSVATDYVSRYFPGYFNIIPNGIDFEHFEESRPRLPEFDDGKLNILFVGRPEKRKGLQYLLRAFLRVRRERPDTRLIVVGAGDFSRYEQLPELSGDAVFRSDIPFEELPDYHHSADIFCSPATGGESQGIALLEAMAAGVPVVASNIDGFATVLTPGIDGVLVPPKDDEALASALLDLVARPEERRRLGEEGRREAKRYSWDRVARQVLAYYERLLHERVQVAEAKARAAEPEPVG